MCPLRIILIFLSAAIAAFFVLRNANPTRDRRSTPQSETEADAVPLSSKVCSGVRKGAWTFVDMASGKYLWRTLVSSPENRSAAS
ncbi:hypothetical protein M569_14430 [Genlisea aurea]|uniref:Uncharacterized protein n=1 Tax=Genlisea aurea TaxID=192259 RepID=S8DC82_9LAMI|nr:hypothetical protein M569_14430 [Genlisea aurea]